MDKKWHHNHLCCDHCDKPLSTQSFVTVDGKPWCNKCHDEDLANRGEKCEQVIVTYTKDVDCGRWQALAWRMLCFQKPAFALSAMPCWWGPTKAKQLSMAFIGRRCVKAPLAAAISPQLISPTHPTRASHARSDMREWQRARPHHRELGPLLFANSVWVI